MWEIFGITGEGAAPPSIAGTESGPALVLGGARCVWDDIREAYKLLGDPAFENEPDCPPPCTIVAVNDIGAYFRPMLHHLCSRHEDQLEPVRRLRRPNACNSLHVVTHTDRKRAFRVGRAKWDPADVEWKFTQGAGGTSAMFAALVAIALGHKRVILCGVPLDGSGHFFDPAWQGLKMFTGITQQNEWQRAGQLWIAGRVRSMSGRTRDWLGAPDKEWVQSSEI